MSEKGSYTDILSIRGPAPIKNLPEAKLFGEMDGIKLYNTSYTNVPKFELHYKDKGDYGIERNRALNENQQWGVKTMTKEEQDFERSISFGLLKKFTMKIFSMDFSRFSFPVGYSEPRSFLERTTDLFSFLATNYIEKAVNSGSDDTRLLYITMGVVAGFQLYMQSKKPWNPVLGETYYGEWPNGVKIYGEQISHHPPVSAFQILGNGWRCSAKCNFKILAGIREVDIVQAGTFVLEVDSDNGEPTIYEWVFPTIAVYGILKGERLVRVLGPAIIKDNTNDLTCKLDLWPSNDKKKGITNAKHSTVYGGIFPTSKFTLPNGNLDEKKIQYDLIVTGDFLNTVSANGEVIFNIRNDLAHRPKNASDDSKLLPSDCRYRFDRALLIQERVDDSDAVKIMIEEMQRREEKLRECVPLVE